MINLFLAIVIGLTAGYTDAWLLFVLPTNWAEPVTSALTWIVSLAIVSHISLALLGARWWRKRQRGPVCVAISCIPFMWFVLLLAIAPAAFV